MVALFFSFFTLTSIAQVQNIRGIILDKNSKTPLIINRHQQAFEPRHPDYLRMDFKIGFRQNKKRITQEWSLDIQNMTNRRNICAQTINTVKGDINTLYQTRFTSDYAI